ncbi:MAG: heavy metal translocating P-type ATPase [Planctomycetota bacterium]
MSPAAANESPLLDRKTHRDATSIRPCAHCGLPTRTDDPATWHREPLQSDSPPESTPLVSTPLVFCCHGCMGAYALIHDLGLQDFYSLRDRSNAEVAPVRSQRRHQVLNDLDAAGVPVETYSDGLCRVRLAIDGLHCAACSWLIEKMQPTLPGLKSARVNMSDRTLDMVYDPSVTSPANVADRLGRLGYGLSPIAADDDFSATDRALQREHWIGMATAFFLAANAMWIGISLYAGEASGMAPAHAMFLRWTGAVLGLLAAIGPGSIFFRSALASVRARVPHVDIPVAIGLAVGTVGSLVGAAFGRGHIYFDSLASLVFLLRVGRYIQFRAQYRTGLSVSRLLRASQAAAVRIESDGTQVMIPAHRLCEGDVVAVLPGQSLPADGVIIDGTSAMQTAWITGESRPLPVAPGTAWVGGSFNLQSPLRIRVTAAGDQSRIGRLNEMVRQATAQRTPLIRLADRIGGVFVIGVLFLALVTVAVWSWIASPSVALDHTVALLTIACPCALALAAPLVITVALGRAAREQVWIRDGSALERLAKPGILWFDKTGTLTFGDQSVVAWDGTTESLLTAAALESHSDHPAARAIVSFANRADPSWHPSHYTVEQVVQSYGQGIEGRVNNVSVAIGVLSSTRVDTPDRGDDYESMCQSVSVECDGVHQGTFLLGDRERPGAIEALRRLVDRGWKIGLLSGDRASVVDALAERLRAEGVPLVDVQSEQTPEQKLAVILASRSSHPTTVMVGDGINDAAALAAADVGIAIRGTGETCLRNAPVYIPDNQLDSIVRLVDASQNTVRGIHRCFAASLLYNAITISLAVTGWIHPLIAALFMPLSGITVLTMALSARTFPPSSKTVASEAAL